MDGNIDKDIPVNPLPLKIKINSKPGTHSKQPGSDQSIAFVTSITAHG